ncbi:unnamed protein product, partial [marine sediment metagenome]
THFLDGTVGQPGLSFENEPTTGFYRSGTGEIGVSVLGVDKALFNVDGLNVIGNLTNNGLAYIAGVEPAETVLEVKGAAGQTGNLQEWEDSDDNVLSYIDETGAFHLTDEPPPLLPSGTVMMFVQDAAPPGWTGLSNLDNYMVRVVTASGATGGDSAGTDSPILNDTVPSHTHTGGTATGGGHGHNYKLYDGQADSGAEVPSTAYFAYKDSEPNINMHGSSNANNANMIPSGADSNHTHTLAVDANDPAANWEPKHVNVITASKD